MQALESTTQDKLYKKLEAINDSVSLVNRAKKSTSKAWLESQQLKPPAIHISYYKLTQ
jgi:hypothetical protein